MKYLIKSSILSLAVVFFCTSCSEDTFGIEYELVAPDDLTFSAGDTAIFDIKVTSELGVSQINASEQTTSFSFSELYTPAQREIELSFSAVIPEDQADDTKIIYALSIVNIEGNSVSEEIEVSIEN